MELRQLEYFVTVVEERSFTRAAARLHVVQSTVSAAIKTLESEFGTALLKRTSKHVELTDVGEMVLDKAREVIYAAQQVQDIVDAALGGLRGEIRIGTPTAQNLLDLPGLLAAFHARYPGVHVRFALAARGSQELAEAVETGHLDIAAVSLPSRSISKNLNVWHLASVPMSAILPVGHRLTSGRPVQLRDLADDPFVDLPLGYGSRLIVDQAFDAAGLRRDVAFEVSDIQSAAAFVARGLGVAIMPNFSDEAPAGVTRAAIVQPELRWTLTIVTSKKRTPRAAIQVFLGMVEEYVVKPERLATLEART